MTTDASLLATNLSNAAIAFIAAVHGYAEARTALYENPESPSHAAGYHDAGRAQALAEDALSDAIARWLEISSDPETPSQK